MAFYSGGVKIENLGYGGHPHVWGCSTTDTFPHVLLIPQEFMLEVIMLFPSFHSILYAHDTQGEGGGSEKNAIC